MGIEVGLGADERRLLDALHGVGPVGLRLKKEMAQTAERARYKIEVHFGKNRGVARESLNAGAVLIWESGRRFHGGGDDKMYWCGYTADQGFAADEVCGKPIETKNFIQYHVICPHCQRENILSPDDRVMLCRVLKSEGRNYDHIARLPIVAGEKFFRMTPMNLSKLVYKYWMDLRRNADIYIKFHATDIRCRGVPEVGKPDVYRKARQKRKDGLLIYPLANIIKDTIHGADPVKRFYACFTA